MTDAFAFNIYVIPSLFALLVIVGFIVYVYSKNPYSLLNKLFIVFLVFVAIWAVSEVVNTLTTSPAVVELSLRVGAIGWIFIGPAFLLFVLTFVRQERLAKNFWLLLGLAGVSLAILFLAWRSNFIVTYDLERLAWGWQAPPGKYFPLFGLWITFLFLFAFYHVLRYYLKAKVKEERSQAILIFLAILPSFIFGMVSQVVYPIFFESHSALLEAVVFPFTSLSLALFLGIAIIKYKLFIISPSLVIPNIINTMSEALIVFNPSLYIEMVNKTTLDLLGYHSSDELVGKKVENIIVGGNVWDTFMSRGIEPLRRKKEVKNLELKFLTKDGREIPVNFSASSVKSPEGELTGIVSLAYDIEDRKKLIRSLEQKLAQLKDAKINLERSLGEKL